MSIDTRIKQLEDKIQELKETKKFIEENQELCSSYINIDNFIKELKIIKDFIDINEAMDYLYKRNERDIYGRYPNNPMYSKPQTSFLYTYFKSYAQYLQAFGKLIKIGKAPLKPDDVFDIMYHWNNCFRDGEVKQELVRINENGRIELLTVNIK